MCKQKPRGFDLLRVASIAIFVSILLLAGWSNVRAQTAADRSESERSDKLTGGHIETADFEPNQPDIRLTLNVPSFRLTFWQNGMEVKSYYVGVGMKDYPIYIGAREATEIATMPDAERQEIRDIYAAKGFSGKLLEEVVDTITNNRETWLATMMDEELHLQPVQSIDILRTSLVITIATLIGHLIPLIPFMVLPRSSALVLAIVLSALVLFGVGVYSAVTLVGDWRRSGLKMVAIGLGAAGIGFLIARLFNSAGG